MPLLRLIGGILKVVGDRLLYTTILRGFWTLFTDHRRSFERWKTNEKTLEVSIQMNGTLKGSKLLEGTNWLF